MNHLVKVFDGGLTSIVDLRMIPWGNAFIQSDGTFVCQVTILLQFFFFSLFFESVCLLDLISTNLLVRFLKHKQFVGLSYAGKCVGHVVVVLLLL